MSSRCQWKKCLKTGRRTDKQRIQGGQCDYFFKIPAIGRKNYLFVASATGGCRAAIHYSLVSSAKANGVEPFAWLKDVFTRLPYHRGGTAFAQAADDQPVSADELDYLLPDVWLNANPQNNWDIDKIRRKEREAKDV